ncbi:hypothetical protein EZV76_15825 [Flagellimonas alvinocaridis]|uniref:Uncharacterized protein n=1 Tax=Flagellimonas alvinocaridis TaxID=2530200 RepID=A0A4S8RT46_9FLAO|nr:hypothetical protein [Allomuricauda alvinocaridis]THV57084.1 hypothetical protein EZV76_15825 [Allomuricauda alvinocaridis]
MVHKVIKVLSFGSKLEKYALSFQAVAKCVKTLHSELDSIWDNEETKGSTPKRTVKKLVDSVTKKEGSKNVQEG